MPSMNYYAIAGVKDSKVCRTWTDCETHLLKYPGAKFCKCGTKEGADTFIKENSKVMYYAVVKGKAPGVYSTLDACLDEVNGVPDSYFKSFARKEEAEQFLVENKVEEESRRQFSKWLPLKERCLFFLENSDLEIQWKKHTVVHTDGSCLYNGYLHAEGGYGVYWGKDHQDNNCDYIRNRTSDGHFIPPTNIRAELTGALAAVTQRLENERNKTPQQRAKNPLTFITDCMYVCNVMNLYVHKWEAEEYITNNGQPVANQDLISLLYQRCKEIPVQFKHVPDLDNKQADELALLGRLKTPETERFQDVRSSPSRSNTYKMKGEVTRNIYTDVNNIPRKSINWEIAKVASTNSSLIYYGNDNVMRSFYVFWGVGHKDNDGNTKSTKAVSPEERVHLMKRIKLWSAIVAIEKHKQNEKSRMGPSRVTPLIIQCDASYVYNVMNFLVYTYEEKGYMKTDGTEPSNSDLIRKLYKLASEIPVRFELEDREESEQEIAYLAKVLQTQLCTKWPVGQSDISKDQPLDVANITVNEQSDPVHPLVEEFSIINLSADENDAFAIHDTNTTEVKSTTNEYIPAETPSTSKQVIAIPSKPKVAVNSTRNSSKKKSDAIITEENSEVVFIGGYVSPGQLKETKGGWAVRWKSQSIENRCGFVTLNPTENRCFLKALIEAMTQAKQLQRRSLLVKIHNEKYIKEVTEKISRWAANDYVDTKGKQRANKDLLETLWDLLRDIPILVEPLSRKDNITEDMAKLGSEKKDKPSTSRTPPTIPH